MISKRSAAVISAITIPKLFIRNFLKKIKYGKIILKDNESEYIFEGCERHSYPVVQVTVKDKNFYFALMMDGSLGAARSYMRGEWEVDNLSHLIEIIIKNQVLLKKLENPLAKFIGKMKSISRNTLGNNLSISKKNILKHYDLGNEFFELILDKTMMYSCGIYDQAHITQEEASLKKIALICEKMRLSENDHILEIGSGWGGFALHAAKEYGCRVTTTTISDKQHEYFRKKIEEQGLEDKIFLLKKDYRQLEGKYDKIVSIEMIEAIGHKYYDKFFHTCERLLKSGGELFLQCITINDKTYKSARNEIDFIKKYIFPGGCLPSLRAIFNSVYKATDLHLLELRDIGQHYVMTLNDWLNRMTLNKALIYQQGFDSYFFRMWEFYFCYCMSGFQTRHISAIQAHWKKTHDSR